MSTRNRPDSLVGHADPETMESEVAPERIYPERNAGVAKDIDSKLLLLLIDYLAISFYQRSLCDSVCHDVRMTQSDFYPLISYHKGMQPIEGNPTSLRLEA